MIVSSREISVAWDGTAKAVRTTRERMRSMVCLSLV
jgi:hypothetical protein